jgi:hypothetical protein
VPNSTAWVILTSRYGGDKRQPSERDLARAIDELFDESPSGMREPDFAEHPNAWLRYGFDDGPLRVIDVYRTGVVIFSKYADADLEELQSENAVRGLDGDRALSLWKWLANGEIKKIVASYPECGW